MHERRPAPEEHVERRSERAGGSVRGRDTLELASQMGNVAFTALARSLARQPDDGSIEFPPDHIGPSGEEPTVGPDGVLEFPPDHIGPSGDGQGATVGPDGTVEFPPEQITAGTAGAGAAAGEAGGSVGS